jgi:hypothetical protein
VICHEVSTWCDSERDATARDATWSLVHCIFEIQLCEASVAVGAWRAYRVAMSSCQPHCPLGDRHCWTAHEVEFHPREAMALRCSRDSPDEHHRRCWPMLAAPPCLPGTAPSRGGSPFRGWLWWLRQSRTADRTCWASSCAHGGGVVRTWLVKVGVLGLRYIVGLVWTTDSHG